MPNRRAMREQSLRVDKTQYDFARGSPRGAPKRILDRREAACADSSSRNRLREHGVNGDPGIRGCSGWLGDANLRWDSDAICPHRDRETDDSLVVSWAGVGADGVLEGGGGLRRRLQDAATSLGIRGALYRSMVCSYVE